ncbi:Serine hydroxymethyltransferase [Trichinella nelsoni]|uniref:Serine hydroxymethyltransferase n=1 Tax=Trichinella nelsoni TaxID=6336 RepID=A0A0V0SJI3_9BILA|nr:Serine hydroxymethyltransferase [Trichinella nelsoni]
MRAGFVISAVAVALKLAKEEEFVAYQKQVLKNAKALCERLQHHGYKISTDGTENHMMLLDLRPVYTDGARVEHVLELVHIACNKNTCPGDKSALRPGGIRLGSPAMTSRGLQESDFVQIGDFIHEAIQLTLKIQKLAGKTIKDFRAACEENDEFKKLCADMKARVQSFARNYPMPGFSVY